MSKGRGNDNSISVRAAMKMNIDLLRKTKCINKGATTDFVTSWTNGSTINCRFVYTSDEQALHLNYLFNKKPIHTIIKIDEVRSNFGGVNLYFICPLSGKRCKILYMCYGSEVFKCRQAYQHKIYYPYQLASKLYKASEMFFVIEEKINKLHQLRKAETYKGKETKRQKTLNKLYAKADQLQLIIDEQIRNFEEKMYNEDFTL